MKQIIFDFLCSVLGTARMKGLVVRLFSKLVSQANNDTEIQGLLNTAGELVNQSGDKQRIISSANTKIPVTTSFKDKNERLSVQIMPKTGVWLNSPDFESKVPGMILKEEEQYYLYIGQFYQGLGEVVEVGPWLGRSTTYICQGLISNPGFADKKIQVYDDFVWRPHWMNLYVKDDEKLALHADFKPLFDKYTSPISNKIDAYKQKLSVYDGNDNVPDLVWNGKKIEMIYVDCGRTMEVNKKWFTLLKPFFIPGVTLIIMQDWRLHREIPALWYNQTKDFTDSLNEELIELHEVSKGGIATFLYQPGHLTLK